VPAHHPLEVHFTVAADTCGHLLLLLGFNTDLRITGCLQAHR